jgi:3-methylcrotonyl-CoA carboxylase alpha subunit
MKKLFIANRGEILRRIAHTAKSLGISTCAIAEKSDLGFMNGLLDDPIFMTPTIHTYLDGEQMIALAKERRCDAVHPGFGFLSENAHFAYAVEQAGLLWVGPRSEAIRAMASKSEAQALAEKLGINTVPGCRGLFYDRDPKACLRLVQNFAQQHGLPILVKAALGGGGKGMRVVREIAEIESALQRASSEAQSSFADSELIVEKYLPESRHVEVQILGDKHGGLVVVGDRDCSLQRRHQKIVEESPAPSLGPKTRIALHQAALKLAEAVAYDSTGTVEYLVNWDDSNREATEQEWYFLEMNTRLQVEHPVTEMVHGVDLVAQQLGIAQGKNLARSTVEAASAPRGHSFEVRIYAEDPEKQFSPAPGRVWEFVRADGPGIRWEAGIQPGSEISTRFDPMVAKLIVWGENRTQAIDKLNLALRTSFYAGPPSNLEFLLWLTQQNEFRHGVLATDYIGKANAPFISFIKEQHQEILAEMETMGPQKWMVSQPSSGEEDLSAQSKVLSIFHATAHQPKPPLSDGSEEELIKLAFWSNHAPSGEKIRSGKFRLPNSRGEPFACFVEGPDEDTLFYQNHGWYGKQEWKKHQAHWTQRDVTHSVGDIQSPVPGKVVKVLVKISDRVTAAQKVIILESMKMEYEIQVQIDGVVKEIGVKEGQQVQAGQNLMRLE